MVTIRCPEGSRGKEHRLFGKPTGGPLQQIAGARGRPSSSLGPRQPRLCRSESGTPPPRLHPRTSHRHPTHCGTARRSPPAHALAPRRVPPSPARSRLASRALAFCSPGGSWLPDLPRLLERGQGGAGARSAGGRRSQSCSVPLYRESCPEKGGETEMVK